jgi:hypothetical protein
MQGPCAILPDPGNHAWGLQCTGYWGEVICHSKGLGRVQRPAAAGADSGSAWAESGAQHLLGTGLGQAEGKTASHLMFGYGGAERNCNPWHVRGAQGGTRDPVACSWCTACQATPAGTSALLPATQQGRPTLLLLLQALLLQFCRHAACSGSFCACERGSVLACDHGPAEVGCSLCAAALPLAALGGTWPSQNVALLQAQPGCPVSLATLGSAHAERAPLMGGQQPCVATVEAGATSSYALVYATRPPSHCAAMPL